MHASVETRTPLANRGGIGFLSPDTATTAGIDPSPFAPGSYIVRDPGSATTLPVHDRKIPLWEFVPDDEGWFLDYAFGEAICRISSSISFVLSIRELSNSIMIGTIGRATQYCKHYPLPILDLTLSPYLEMETLYEQHEVASVNNDPSGLFFDEMGARFSFANVQASTVEELQEEGFPFYSPSEDKPEAIESLRQILLKRGKSR